MLMFGKFFLIFISAKYL